MAEQAASHSHPTEMLRNKQELSETTLTELWKTAKGL